MSPVQQCKENSSLTPAVRSALALLTSVLLLCAQALAFDTPLSEQAVREAYFLGQRRDKSKYAFLNKYTKLLPAPKEGPQIYSVTFLTPFALLVRHSSQQPNYSAQQAAKDHHADDEAIFIEIEILFTASYGALISTPTSSRSGSPTGCQLRPSDFWKDFQFDVFDGEKKLADRDLTGEPRYACEGDGSCTLIGADIRLELPAKTPLPIPLQSTSPRPKATLPLWISTSPPFADPAMVPTICNTGSSKPR